MKLLMIIFLGGFALVSKLNSLLDKRTSELTNYLVNSEATKRLLELKANKYNVK